MLKGHNFLCSHACQALLSTLGGRGGGGQGQRVSGSDHIERGTVTKPEIQHSFLVTPISQEEMVEAEVDSFSRGGRSCS